MRACVGVRHAGRVAFLEDVSCGKSQADASRLKRVVKSFCGGKKKGTEGTPGQTKGGGGGGGRGSSNGTNKQQQQQPAANER